MAEDSAQPKPQVTTTPKPHNWKKVILTIVFIVGVVAVIAGIYWFMVINKSSEDSDLTGPVPKVEPKTSTESTKKDETAGWKTYTNDTFDYSIKYPSDWLISPASNGNLLLNQIGKKAQLTEEELNRPTISIVQGEFTCSTDYKSCDLVGDINIGGVIWKKYTYEDSDGTKHEVYFYESKNLQIFTTPKNQQNLINKVVSTFVFLD